MTDNSSPEFSSDYSEPEAPQQQDAGGDYPPPAKGICGWFQFHNVTMAKGYCINGMARGALVMSNIYLSTAFIYLGEEQAGCVEDGKVLDECDGKVYGMKPASLVANIAVISGVLSALFMPLFGAILDYTAYRWTVGVGASVLMILIQGAQTMTMPETWFVMSILQALAGFLYQIEVLAIYAYLPDIARIVGETFMTKFQSTFTMIQFEAQISYLIIIFAVGIAIGVEGGADDVTLARISQAINVVWVSIIFWLSWRLMPQVSASRTLPQGGRLWLEGFLQVGRTAKSIFTDYPRSLCLFFWAVIFAEAGANAFTVVSVIYLSDKLGLTGTEISIFFVVALLGTIPGTQVGRLVTSKMNPKNSWRTGLTFFVVVTNAGAFLLTKENKIAIYVWGLIVGIHLGWHYPTEGLMFSMCLPKGQDAELSGFYVYCTQIIVWLPPLVFSGLVQAGIDQKWGVVALSSFFVIAVGIISLLPAWPTVLVDVHKFDDVVVANSKEGNDSSGKQETAPFEIAVDPDGEDFDV